MNAFTKIEAQQPFRIADAMREAGVRIIEKLPVGYRVVMDDGSEGKGFQINEAIARAVKVAA